MTPKPIKRSVQLAPLSRDHHEGLLFVWKIRGGLKNGTPIPVIGQFVQWFWETHLENHFRQEEQSLAPYFGGDELFNRMIEEHQNIEALIHINANITDEALLTQIGDAVNDHIRFEERELFPHIEQALSVEQLDVIYKNLPVESNPISRWENEFWNYKKT